MQNAEVKTKASSTLPANSVIALPHEWKTTRLLMRDATLVDIPRLRAVFNACATIEAWDPTFREESEAGIVELVNKSLIRDAGADTAFQLQAICDIKSHEILGYYHLYFGVPRPDSAFISMAVIHPDLQSQQFGKEAISGLINELERIGAYTGLLLQVYLKNWPALRFWFVNGFDTIREYRGDKFLTPDGHASLILEHKLSLRSKGTAGELL